MAKSCMFYSWNSMWSFLLKSRSVQMFEHSSNNIKWIVSVQSSVCQVMKCCASSSENILMPLELNVVTHFTLPYERARSEDLVYKHVCFHINGYTFITAFGTRNIRPTHKHKKEESTECVNRKISAFCHLDLAHGVPSHARTHLHFYVWQFSTPTRGNS